MFLFSNFALRLVFLPDSLRKHHSQREDQLPPQQVTKRWAHLCYKAAWGRSRAAVMNSLPGRYKAFVQTVLFFFWQKVVIITSHHLSAVCKASKRDTDVVFPFVSCLHRRKNSHRGTSLEFCEWIEKKNQTLEGHKHRGIWLQSVCKYIPNTL